MAKTDSSPNEATEMIMSTVISGFRHVTNKLLEIEATQKEMREQQQKFAQAAYQGMTGSGKSRYVATLVSMEEEAGRQRGAKARVAKTLDLTPGRITQLLNSDKNRKNGK